MSSESISQASDVNSSSSSTSTRCVDSHGSVTTEPDSAADSLNSLIQGNTIDNVECADSCLKVECSLANQCCGDDSNSSSKLKQRKSICCNPIGQCVWGVLLVTVSISGFIFTPLDCMLWEKLNMRPGLPPYEWWADPPDEVRLRVYVFNVTNHERFMMGLDEKLNVQEIGPIVYLEKLLHTNIVFNENSTLTYTATRYPIFLPEENSIDLNTTLIIPNMALLGMSSYLHDAPFLVRTGFRLLASSHRSQFFIKRTVYEYLWDYRESLLDTSRNLAPGLVPVNNLGVLARIYSDFTDEITVTIGPQWGHKRFFQIDKFRGESQLPGYEYDKCPDRIVGSTEGVMYHQRLTKQDVLLYWRKTVCKLMPLYFDSELKLDDVLLYRYNLSENVFSRIINSTDCYNTKPSLPAGLSDASKCYFNLPIVASYPHFYTGEPANNYVTGYRPDRYKHNSYTIVEPLTGTPFRSVARMQSNLRIHDLSGFYHDYTKFSNLVLPLFWAEYNQEGLPSRIQATIYFMTVILPPLSIVVLVLMLYLGCHLILKQIYVHQLRNRSLISVLRIKSKNVNCKNLANNKLFSYETENFIKNK